MDVPVKFGDSTLNSGRSIQLFAGCTILCTFVQYLTAFCSRAEASDVISSMFLSLTVTNKLVKFRNPRLNRSSEIRAEAVGGSIFDRFRTSTNADQN